MRPLQPARFRQTGSLDAELPGDCECSILVISRDHLDADAGRLCLRYRFLYLRPWRVHQPDQAHEREILDDGMQVRRRLYLAVETLRRAIRRPRKPRPAKSL